jgi:hypothetical protein
MLDENEGTNEDEGDGRSCPMMTFASQTSKRNLRLVLYFIPRWMDGFQSGSSIQYTFWAA